MRKPAEIEARRKRRFRVTVEHHRSALLHPIRFDSTFAAQTDRFWVGAMTFIRTRAGLLLLAVLLDLYSRKVVAWSISARANLAMALNALCMALTQRRPAEGLVHHTDRGQLYRARGYLDTLFAYRVEASMSAKGRAYYNAVAESFF